ncbi:hypothetical protein [Kosakonia phage Kc304]|uniref:NAD(+)--arginine ADP-ribosyltransferase n=2 Tax=Winklervirus chi14 TaxID=2560752 RepID=A0A1Z1LYJ8_9CAUD|nr:Alt-like RNA polymerase ADP-ribosyltransferase [Serratia phage CHI14]ARW57623.1 RNA polymerase ADP-ribosylase [Serratia phage CHI14]ARW57898.1 RNA polymerase ADP-ribosylase [Serratia phage CBH8]QYN80645.1 hypothetical protein [Kosakonia phage Kc304]
MTDNLLVEVFDSDSEKNYPVINLNPKAKVPQLWAVKVPGNDKLVARMVSYLSQGDAIKQVKQGDKYAHVILMSLSDKGTPAELKGGLGSDPVGALNTIFDTVYAVVKKNRMDAVMFRFPAKKMKGQEKTVQRIMNRLVMARTGGQFKVLDALYNFTAKHAYVFIYRKARGLEDISGIPEINTDLYTKVESQVGDVFVSKKTGNNVTKEEAIAGSIAEIEKDRTDRAIINRTKVSRRAIASSQSLPTDVILDPSKFEEYETTAAEFSRPASAEVIPEAEEIVINLTSKAAKSHSSALAASSISWRISELTGLKPSQAEKLEPTIQKELEKRIGDANLTSVESMQAFTQTILDKVEEYKHNFVEKHLNDAPMHFSREDKEAMALKMWNISRVKLIKDALQGYAKNVSQNIHHITMMRTPKQYTPAEKRGIKEYCGSGYYDINNMLLGRYDETSRETMEAKEVTTAIKNLDDAFKKGDRIPEGLTLWRAQTIRKPIYDSLVKNRVFYFRNYVSTSLMPIIFGGWKGNLGVAMTSDNTRDVLNIDGGTEDAVIKGHNIRLSQEKGETEVKVSVGWAIEGAHKINVVYPGDVSHMPHEMEIILPRGTMLKINKITDASYNDGIEYSNQKFIQAEVMTSEQLDEAVVYDGDALIESGELVAMDEPEGLVSFASFASSNVRKKANESLGLLASFIDLSDIPEKFIQG